VNKEQQEKLNRLLVNVGDLGFRRRVVEIVNKLDIRSGEKILDCGCGEGFYLMVLSELYPECDLVGLDHDYLILGRAREWLRDRDKIQWVSADIYTIPFPDAFFDKIILSEVLEHVRDDYRALLEVKRVLKPGGKLLITVPNHNYPFLWDPLNWIREHLGLGHFSSKSGFLGGIWAMHLRLYYPGEIKALVERADLKIKEMKVLTHYCFPFNHNILYLGKQFYTRLPVPDVVTNTMEKFQWRKVGRTKLSLNPIKLVFGIFKAIDRLNKRPIELSRSSMGILVVCKK